MSTVLIRNGWRLCARCRANGCMTYAGGRENDEVELVSDEECECCEVDSTADDGFEV